MHRMTSPTTRKLAAAALAAVGVIHLILSPEYLSEQAYIGVLFIAGGLVPAARLAVALWRADNVPSWLLGALTMAGMGIGFVLSRTTGLPGFHESEWELSGIVSPRPRGRLRRRRDPGAGAPPRHRRAGRRHGRRAPLQPRARGVAP